MAKNWADASDVVVYKHRRQPAVVGKRLHSGLKSVPRRIFCFVGRLDMETSADDLTAYLTKAGIKEVRCSKLVAKNGYEFFSAAFRVSCDMSSIDLFYDESIWPEGVELRDWFFYNKHG